MDQSLGMALTPEIQDDLQRGFHDVWELGANFILGWRLSADGVTVFHTPCHGISEIALRMPPLFSRKRHLVSDDEADQLMRLGIATARIPLATPLAPDDETSRAIDAILRNYTVTYSECRAVSLFDIVNFSLNSAYDQIAQLNFLSYCLNTAAKFCGEQGFPIELRTSTTGDGFYVWNRAEGFVADQALFLTTALAIAANNSLTGGDRPSRGVPKLRCGIGFGNHFEYHQVTGMNDEQREFIVGDVTIELSRLIAMALPEQVLVSSYNRRIAEDELRVALGTDMVDTPTFIALSQGFIGKAAGMKLPDASTIESVNAYLTGDRISDDEFTIKQYSVTDKHGISHGCFNLKFNVEADTGTDIYVGLLDGDLENFAARHMEKQDIRVRIA
jgi:class 3 adenylate cyclase